MNVIEADVLRTLNNTFFSSQRALSKAAGYSLGVINKTIKKLTNDGYLDDKVQLTKKAELLIRSNTPENAIILAAGSGMRMVPINHISPKALLEVKGEKLIERLISQLHDAGISDITVVVGFMKESFEYLIDKYGVDLVVNNDYVHKNTLHSLSLVADRISNTYILPCDLWLSFNPFSKTELYSWYMVSDQLGADSSVRINRKKELINVTEKESGNRMVGVSYITKRESSILYEQIRTMDSAEKSTLFWEDALFNKGKLSVSAREIKDDEYVEINTYEQLRDFEAGSNNLKSDAITTIATALNCKESEIKDIKMLKKGMTNRSFEFRVKGNRYIMRIPGEGTELLINRRQEVEVYKTISGLGFCDDPIFIDPYSGYKITKYLEDVRPCDASNTSDLEKCMDKLRALHEMKLEVKHLYDLFAQIDFYESLREEHSSVYNDYEKTKSNVYSLKAYIDEIKKEYCLTHIDAVPDNFLFYKTGHGEELQLTDWEYSGMQDPHVDIAMFCIYSLYDKQMCDRLIDIYFRDNCTKQNRVKIYSYISVCGLLWSNWCEYKNRFGIEFGEYALRQYRYAKEFYRYAKALIEEK